MDYIKYLASIAWAALLEAVVPIQFSIYLLFGIMVLNSIVGYHADARVHKARFSLKKAFDAIKLLILYLLLILLIRLNFEGFGEVSLANKSVKYATWWVSYWYVVNITKNAILIYPREENLKILYNVLTLYLVEFLKNKFKNDVLHNSRNDKKQSGKESGDKKYPE